MSMQSITVKLNLEEEEIEKLIRIAKKRGISKSKLVKEVLSDWLFNRFA